MLFPDKIAEDIIKAAVARGEFDNLPGQGKPIVFDDTSGIPEELRAGYRILKNSGYLPPEIALRSEIKRVEELLCCLLYTSPSPRDGLLSRMPSSA